MKLDSKKSKAAVKNSAVKQKKVKAKAANPAKAPKVKKTLNTKKAQKVNNKPKIKGKKKLSTKLILIPVFIVGFVSVISSGLSLKNLSKVNDAASQIVDTSMVGTEMLNDIEMETVNIHTLALAHIISASPRSVRPSCPSSRRARSARVSCPPSSTSARSSIWAVSTA